MRIPRKLETSQMRGPSSSLRKEKDGAMLHKKLTNITRNGPEKNILLYTAVNVVKAGWF